MKKEFISKSASETRKIAAELAQTIQGGETIALTGNLGAGKTVFVQGFAKALGIRAPIQSPTFVIMNVIPVKGHAFTKLVHVDCYRLSGVRELRDIGLEEYIKNPDAVVLIEWAEKAQELIPQKSIMVRLEHKAPEQRRIMIS